jgi:hypothetical protein
MAAAVCCAAMRWLRRNSAMVSTTSVYFQDASWSVVVPKHCPSCGRMSGKINEVRIVDTNPKRSVSVGLGDDNAEVVKARNGDSFFVSEVG